MAAADVMIPEEERLRREQEQEEEEEEDEARNMERLLLLQEEQEREQQQQEQARARARANEVGNGGGREVENEAIDGDNEIHNFDVDPLVPHHHNHNNHNNNNEHNNENNEAYLQYLYHARYRSKRMILQISYTSSSFFAAAALLIYAMRTREQWYLALVFVSSSKWAYVVLGNALIASCVASFRCITNITLGGLRLHETEGMYDFFRWNVTETCLALTMFRSELTVGTGMYFLLLILTKCLHWVADSREGHLRMTEEAIVVVEGTNAFSKRFQGWPKLQAAHIRLCLLLILFLGLDILAVKICGQDLFTSGPSVSILFAFEAAILLVSAWNNIILWSLHVLDGLVHYCHDHSSPKSMMHRFIHPWKENKATFIFAVELQSQAAKLVFYVTFFAIVLTYYGMPINLFREVYLSFQSLRQRLTAFAKYRNLMASMNKFPDVTTEEEFDASGSGKTCIICRDEMTVLDCKQLPGCGHIFHKSCLREWLVQQQSCPTCRGDIATMEREYQAKQARIAREEEQQKQQQEKEKQNETTTNDHNNENGTETIEEMPTTATTEEEQLEKFRNGIDQLAKDMTELSHLNCGDQEHKHKKETKNYSKGITIQHRPQKIEPMRENHSCFPALYKINKEEGTGVWHKATSTENDTREPTDTTPTLIRMIPYGVMVLCLEQENIAVGMIDDNTNTRKGGEVKMLRIPEDLKQHIGCEELNEGTSWICAEDCACLGGINLPITLGIDPTENKEMHMLKEWIKEYGGSSRPTARKIDPTIVE